MIDKRYLAILILVVLEIQSVNVKDLQGINDTVLLLEEILRLSNG